jgi:Flp pilus assembly protein TadD
MGPGTGGAGLAELLQHGAALLNQGRAAEALALCRPALNQHPRNPELLNLAAASALHSGDPATAERLWRQALALLPGQAQLHLSLGVLLAQLGRGAEAEASLRQALRLEPRAASAHYNLGLLLARSGRGAEAQRHYEQTLALNPRALEALYNLAGLQAADGRIAQAEAGYRRLLQLEPRHAQAWANLGALQLGRAEPAAAVDSYRRALALQPAQPEALLDLAQALVQAGQAAEAAECCRKLAAIGLEDAAALCRLGAVLYGCGEAAEGERRTRQALALDPSLPLAHYNLGVTAAAAGLVAEAESHYRRALACQPGYADAAFNLAVLLDDAGRTPEAELQYRQVLDLDPGYAGASRNLASLLLRQGRYAEGWLRYEARYSPRMKPRTIHAPELPFPQWRGESLAGRSILVWPEQGYGDQLQLCRYLPQLKARGAARVTLVCPPPLAALFELLPGVDRVVPEGTPGPVEAHDCWTLLMSIPHCLDNGADGIPDRIPYLQVPPSRRARWQGRIAPGGVRIGLVWRGSSINAIDAQRSLGLESLAPLWQVPGARFFALQKGDGEDQAATPPPGQPLLALGAEIADFADAAALLEQLDLLICVDTAMAHLAGALGRPCWALLSPQADWRYPEASDHTPWYPAGLRLFRRAAGEEWGAVIARLQQALQALAARTVA